MHRTARTTAIVTAAVLSLIAPAVAAQAAPPTPASTTVRTATNHASAAESEAYWTPQRLAGAQPMAAPRSSAATGRGSAQKAGTQRKVPAATPASAPATATETATTLAASEWVTIGRLVFNVPGRGDYACSANVVASNNRDVIATARHCVMDIGTGQTYNSFRFAPAYDRGNAPYGWWNWRSMGWRIDDTSPGGDNAFIVLTTGGIYGQHIQDTVGGSGMGFNWDTNNYAHAIGLPAAIDYAVWCEGMPYNGPANGVQIPNCVGLSGGASGGAFIVNYQPSDGSAYQTATFYGTWGSDSYFAYYRDAAWEVYNGAQNA